MEHVMNCYFLKNSFLNKCARNINTDTVFLYIIFFMSRPLIKVTGPDKRNHDRNENYLTFQNKNFFIYFDYDLLVWIIRVPGH